jgi:predicted alpha/beta superfamily hydrolase
MQVSVHYPAGRGDIRLRTDLDWDRDVAPVAVDGTRADFDVACEKPFLYFKPRLGETWSQGDNYLAIAPSSRIEIYPHFEPELHCNACEVTELAGHRFRVFHPPGYDENTLKRYPVLYMHDGQNLFFPEEAFLGNDWKISQTMSTLEAMNIIDKVIVVGIFSRDRMHEYTRDGYHEYGRFIVEELKPYIDAHYRTLAAPRSTAVMGSSLGGVVSFYLAWQWPGVFGNAACMSSTFTYNDDLMKRVMAEEKRDVRFYLDSGWPRDNYEVTRSMRDLLARRGYRFGEELLYFAFPNALHDERSWSTRSHLPFQFFFGKRA